MDGTIEYLINGVQYEVSRDFHGEKVLNELLRQEITTKANSKGSIDELCNQ